MGEVLPFPRPPERPTPENATDDENARYLAMRAQGYTDKMAIEVLVQSRRKRDICRGD